MVVSVAPRSGLLDTDVPLKDKVYGYHRLENPPLIIIDPETNEFCEVKHNDYMQAKEKELRNGAIVPVLNTPPEAKRY